VRAAGGGIFLISEELDEILNLSGRVAVSPDRARTAGTVAGRQLRYRRSAPARSAATRAAWGCLSPVSSRRTLPRKRSARRRTFKLLDHPDLGVLPRVAVSAVEPLHLPRYRLPEFPGLLRLFEVYAHLALEPLLHGLSICCVVAWERLSAARPERDDPGHRWRERGVSRKAGVRFRAVTMASEPQNPIACRVKNGTIEIVDNEEREVRSCLFSVLS